MYPVSERAEGQARGWQPSERMGDRAGEKCRWHNSVLVLCGQRGLGGESWCPWGAGGMVAVRGQVARREQGVAQRGGEVIACHHLRGSSPGRGGGEEDAWLGSGCRHVSMGAVGGATCRHHGCYEAGRGCACVCNNRRVAKAECSIDEEGVRGCGDSKRGDGEHRGRGRQGRQFFLWPHHGVTHTCHLRKCFSLRLRPRVRQPA